MGMPVHCGSKDYVNLYKLSVELSGCLYEGLPDDTLNVVLNMDLPAGLHDVPGVINEWRLPMHGAVNAVIEWRKFDIHVQKSRESSNNYLTNLRELSKMCEFCDDHKTV